MAPNHKVVCRSRADSQSETTPVTFQFHFVYITLIIYSWLGMRKNIVQAFVLLCVCLLTCPLTRVFCVLITFHATLFLHINVGTPLYLPTLQTQDMYGMQFTFQCGTFLSYFMERFLLSYYVCFLKWENCTCKKLTVPKKKSI